MFPFYRLLSKTIHSLCGGLVDTVVKSPLEEDYGLAHPEEIRSAESAFQVTLGAVQLADMLEAFSRKSCGETRHATVTRAVRRLAELPVGRSAILHLHFGKKEADDDEGALQVEIRKQAPKSCLVSFRGSEEAIETMRRIDTVRTEFGR